MKECPKVIGLSGFKSSEMVVSLLQGEDVKKIFLGLLAEQIHLNASTHPDACGRAWPGELSDLFCSPASDVALDVFYRPKCAGC